MSPPASGISVPAGMLLMLGLSPSKGQFWLALAFNTGRDGFVFPFPTGFLLSFAQSHEHPGGRCWGVGRRCLFPPQI